MDEHDLGPNGALVYCMEYLLENSDWLKERLLELGPAAYVLFDCPGQVLNVMLARVSFTSFKHLLLLRIGGVIYAL